MAENHNTSLLKQVLLLNEAGTDQFNPVVMGMPVVIKIRFNSKIQNLQAFVGLTNFPDNEIFFTQDIEDEFLFIHNGIAGTFPFDNIGIFTFIKIELISISTGDITTIDKKLFIIALPENAVQLFDIIEDDFENAFATGATLNCSQMAGIRFFPNFDDEFGNHKFGGAKYFSVFDFGDTENGTQQEFVKRQVNEPIAQVKRILLHKHEIGQQENHDINFLLKPDKNTSSPVSIRVLVKSSACWAHDLILPGS